MALRLADSAVLPFNYSDYGVALSEYAQQMKTMLAGVKGANEGTAVLSNFTFSLKLLTAHIACLWYAYS
jgi:hypothetical protein